MTLRDAIETYGADATRFSLADAGDAVEDANFVEKTANTAILKLYTEKEWMEQAVKHDSVMRSGEMNWMDKVFMSEMQKTVAECKKAYDHMLFREALKVGFYDLMSARNSYRKAVTGMDEESTGMAAFEGLHRDCVRKFMEVQALVLSPICPHWCEDIWMNVLGSKTSIHHALWPTFDAPVDETIIKAVQYLRDLTSKIRAAEDAAAKKKLKKGIKVEAPKESGPRQLKLFVAPTWPEWQEEALNVLKECYDAKTNTFNGQETALLGQKGLLKNKKVMPFVSSTKVCLTRS